MNNREAVKHALATMRISGFEFTEKELEEFEKIAKGEITTEEALQNLFKEIEQLKKDRPEFFADQKE